MITTLPQPTYLYRLKYRKEHPSHALQPEQPWKRVIVDDWQPLSRLNSLRVLEMQRLRHDEGEPCGCIGVAAWSREIAGGI